MSPNTVRCNSVYLIIGVQCLTSVEHIPHIIVQLGHTTYRIFYFFQMNILQIFCTVPGLILDSVHNFFSRNTLSCQRYLIVSFLFYTYTKVFCTNIIVYIDTRIIIFFCVSNSSWILYMFNPGRKLRAGP